MIWDTPIVDGETLVWCVIWDTPIVDGEAFVNVIRRPMS